MGNSRRLASHFTKKWAIAVAVAVGVVPTAAMLATGNTPAAAVVASNPPTGTHSILVFPQRDFVSAAGYLATDQVVVKLIHPVAADGSQTIVSTDPNHPITPLDDPRAAPGAPFAGIVDVNHPGGTCWFTTTPDIRPGDIIEIDIVDGPAATLGELNVLAADATTVQNVTAARPVQTGPATIVVHGTAVANDGASQIPIAQLEQRLVANRDAFDVNGRRTLRAAAPPATVDGTMSYDAPGATTWTATYNGLDAADVTRALGAETRILWLGAAVAPALEGTIFENGAAVIAGPARPACTAPLEILPPPPGSDATPPSDVANLIGATDPIVQNTVHLSWDAATDNIGVTSYGIYRDGIPVFNVQNPDGSAPAPVVFDDKNVPPGTYVYTVDAADAIGNRSANPSNGVTLTTVVQVATLPAGVTANEPPVAPVQIISFPSRDFISSSGFDEADTVDVQLLRHVDGTAGLTIISSADGLVPQANPRAAPGDPFAGIVEVNHPGGARWQGFTPDIRVGDIVRTIAYRSNLDGTPTIRTVDQTTTANITVTHTGVEFFNETGAGNADGSVKVHGVAMQADGQPIPLGQFEQRMVANRDAFVLNGRRTIRAGGAGKDGALVYDADDLTGTHWTATYSGLVQQDVDRIMGFNGFAGAEFRSIWLGKFPLAGLELTIFENEPGLIANGPSIPPCDALCLAEPSDITKPSVPSPFTATINAVSVKNVDLAWTASTDDTAVTGYGVSRDGLRIANLPPTATSYSDVNVGPGPHNYAVDATDAASPDNGAPSGQNKEWGNRSFPATATVTLVDTTPPTPPTGLVAVSTADNAASNGGTHDGTVTLTWTQSVDDVGVDHYVVTQNPGPGSILPTSVAVPTLSQTGMQDGTYTYTVSAVDAANNVSAPNPSITVTVTKIPDGVAPAAVGFVTATVSPDIHGRNAVVSWPSTTDNVGGTGVAGYEVFRNTVKIATVNAATLSYSDLALPAGTYNYAVMAFDGAGNHSLSTAAPSPVIVANDPPLAPHSLIAFPARDFVSATGYMIGRAYNFSLVRGATTYTSGNVTAIDDGSGRNLGVVEVNHPGGACWNVNTPDMRAGDVVRITDTVTGIVEQTTMANVTAERPIAINANTVVIHGTAQDSAGNPIPLGQLDHRLIANRDAFDLSGRRTLRAGAAGDGVLTYDAPGSTRWTATYTGLSSNDVVRAVGGTTTAAGNVPVGSVFIGSESRILWLGRTPLALTETTIFENGTGVLGGPSAPLCTAPGETPVAAATFTPTSLTYANTQFLPAPVATSPVQTVIFSNGGGAPMTITNIYLAGVNPGDYARLGGSCPTVFPATLLNAASCTVTLTFTPKALGLRQAYLGFTDNAANTTDQTVALTATGVDNTNPTISMTPTSKSFGTVNAGVGPTQVFTVSNSSPDPTARSLTIGGMTIGGTNPTDFAIVGNTCTSAMAPGVSCTITVSFNPGARTARSATLTLTHNSAPVVTTTAIALSGTGGNGAVISFSAATITWGTVAKSTSKDQTVTIKNGGTTAATITGYTFSGPGYARAPGAAGGTCGATLAVNASCSVIVRFTAGAVAGTFNGTLTVNTTNGFPLAAFTNLTATVK